MLTMSVFGGGCEREWEVCVFLWPGGSENVRDCRRLLELVVVVVWGGEGCVSVSV